MGLRTVVLGAILLFAPVATAQPDMEGRAAKLFEEGRTLGGEGKWDLACAKFTESLKLVNAVGTRLNLADCLEKRGQFAKAQEMFDEAARADEKSFPERSAMARGRADKLKARLATVVVKIAEPAGLTVTVNGASVTPAPEVTKATDPGKVEVTATAPGKTPFTTSVDAGEGKQVVVEVPALAAIGGDPTPPPTTTAGGSGRKTRVYLAFGLGGAGVLALITGEVFAFRARGRYHDELDSGACTEKGDTLTCTTEEAAERIRDANSSANVATGVIVVGAVLVAAGAVVYFTAPKESATVVTPTAGPGGVGLALSGRF